MLTKKQAIDILYNPFSYTKEKRQEAVKVGIDILDKIAIAEGAKEQDDAGRYKRNK